MPLLYGRDTPTIGDRGRGRAVRLFTSAACGDHMRSIIYREVPES